MAEKIATMVYKCIGCENEIRRPVHKDEEILLGKTKCMKCGEWTLFFKLEVQGVHEVRSKNRWYKITNMKTITQVALKESEILGMLNEFFNDDQTYELSIVIQKEE